MKIIMSLHFSTLWWLFIAIFCSTVKSKPQDAAFFKNMGTGGLIQMGNMAEIVTNEEKSFSKDNSKTKIDAGDDRSNDDDDSSEEIRRKRAIDLDTNAPCYMGTSGGGTGTNDVDVEEARRRLAAARRAKKARQTANKAKNKKKSFSSNDSNEEVPTTSKRRKRQTEVDDLNENMTDADNDFRQKAQQFAEKVRGMFESFINSIHDMAQTIKQQFSGGQTTTTTDNEEI